MKARPIQFAASITLALAACGGSAAGTPGDNLPRPEDPVALPTDAETAELIKNRRESELRSLKWDKDGWDDLWVMLQRVYDKDYKFDPKDKTKDTDGDGVSDYEEMLMGRDATREEPIYTKEQLIEQVRESRRQAIQREIELEANFQKALAAALPHLRELIPDGQWATERATKEAESGSAALRREAVASRLQVPGKERALDDLARKHGVEKVFQDEDGKKLKLSGESLGPIFIQSNDTISAAGISADELWPVQNNLALPNYFPWNPESSTGLNLTGAGQTLGIWEVNGGVRTSHIEMGTTRITQKDGAALDATGHATNVAGTMAASGIGTLFGGFYESRGVAYQANVFSYETGLNFKAEREAAAAGGGADPPLRLSNQSWGLTCGWRREDIDPTAAVNLQWVWYGTTNAAFQEDHKFGFYLADQPAGLDFGSTQLDLFHQSQAPQHLMVYACGNDRTQGPGASPGTYYYRTGASTWVPVSAASFPRDWDDGDAGFYDTVSPPGTSKNVLTIGAIEDTSYTSGGTFLGVGPGSNPALASFSGVGPTDDGRIKPDLVAVGTTNFGIRQAFGLTSGANAYLTAPNAAANNSYNLQAIGTSFAAPAVTGALGLVQQRRAQLYPSLPDSQAWRGSTLKGIAINTCDDVGAEGPDYEKGYGVENARRSVLAVDADHILGRGSLIKEFSLAPMALVSWVVTSDGTEPLAITVPWSDPPGPAITDIASADMTNPMLVNNIDLKVENLQTGVIYYPWILNPDLTTKSAATRALPATRGIDNRNNVEKVSIAAPPPGRYRVTVMHSGGLPGNPAPGTQVVSVVVSGVVPELPTITSIVRSAAPGQFLLTYTGDVGAYFTIQTTTDLLTWTNSGSVLTEAGINSVVLNTGTSDPKRFWRLKRGQP